MSNKIIVREINSVDAIEFARRRTHLFYWICSSLSRDSDACGSHVVMEDAFIALAEVAEDVIVALAGAK